MTRVNIRAAAALRTPAERLFSAMALLARWNKAVRRHQGLMDDDAPALSASCTQNLVKRCARLGNETAGMAIRRHGATAPIGKTGAARR